MVGYPVSPEGELVMNDLEWDTGPGAASDEEVEHLLYTYSGRYVALLCGGNLARVYVDPIGSLGVLYCPSQGIVTSSMFLIPESADTGDRTELVNVLGIPGSEAIYSFGLTPRESVDYLLPNHYLDLSDWTVHRHWPAGDFDYAQDPASVVAEIAGGVRKNVRAIVRNGPVQMSLTAGRDSRMMLACSREMVGDITFVTIALNDRMGFVDRNVAERMAHRMGLRHRLLRAGAPSTREAALWVYRTGCMVDEPRGIRALGAMGMLDATQPYLMGIAGELGRESYWLERDRADTHIGPGELLDRKGTPRHPEILRRATKWFEELPVRNALTTLDLHQIERGLGSWHGFLMYGFPGTARFHSFPYNDRRVFEAMLRLPADYRWSQLLTRDLIASEWPELAAFPYNEAAYGAYGALTRTRRYVGRQLRKVRVRDGA